MILHDMINWKALLRKRSIKWWLTLRSNFGNSLNEAIQSAHESLTGYLLTAKEYHEQIVAPS